MSSSECISYHYVHPEIANILIISLLLSIIILILSLHYNLKHNITNLTTLFSDFTRFYIHTSSPPCRDLTNLDLLQNVAEKASQTSKSNSSRTSTNNDIKEKIDIIDENNNVIKNFKTRFWKITKPNPNQTNIVKPTNYENYSRYLKVNAVEVPKIVINNAHRRHSTFDLLNRTEPYSCLMPNERLNEKSKFKFKQSESYSFDLGNRLYSNIVVNEMKGTGNLGFRKQDLIPPRRSRLMGISDELSDMKRQVISTSSYASTSTPNK
ncbi:unnamed protein product [Brachionus calyciflorus]|uniref:Uncharacterized protein n=1 Tax=Brachionus calyciflorus TaxID=104777 RepID=A0A814B467_9BILA|nr:unnamed protein product [Brachionus calyciflorus]